MNGMVFVLCILAIVFTAGIAKEWMKLKAKKAEQASTPDEYLAQIDALEERIRVLERIVTENKFDLKREIDSL